MSALNKVMEYLGLVDGPEGATEEVKPITPRREPRIATVTTPSTSTSTCVTVIGGRTTMRVNQQEILNLHTTL